MQIARGREKGADKGNEVSCAARLSVSSRRCERLSEKKVGKKEGRIRGGSPGIMEFLPSSAKRRRSLSLFFSLVENLENKTGSTRRVSINVDPALLVLYRPQPLALFFFGSAASSRAKRELTSNSSRAKFNYETRVCARARKHISFFTLEPIQSRPVYVCL